MTSIDIIAGLSEEGKVSVIERLLDCYSHQGKKTAVIINEKKKSSTLHNMSTIVERIASGCICCTTKLQLIELLHQMIATHHPDTILICVPATANLKDMQSLCDDIPDIHINFMLTVIDGKKFRAYKKVLGDVFQEQIADSTTIYIQNMSELSLGEQTLMMKSIRNWNTGCSVLSKPLTELDDTDFF
jgi:G3E family GTPase